MVRPLSTMVALTLALVGCAPSSTSPPIVHTVPTTRSRRVEVHVVGPEVVVVNESERPLELWLAEASFVARQADAREECAGEMEKLTSLPRDENEDGFEEDLSYVKGLCVRLDAATSLASSLVRFPVPVGTSRHAWLGKLWLGGPVVTELSYVLRAPRSGPEVPLASDLVPLPLPAPFEVPVSAFAEGHGVASFDFGTHVLSVTDSGYARASLGYDSRRALAPEAPFGWVEERVFGLAFERGKLYAWGEHLAVEHHGRVDALDLGEGSGANVDATIVASTASGDLRYLLLRKDEMSRGRATSGMCGGGTEAWLYLLEVSPRSVRVLGEPFLLASCMQSIDPDETTPAQRGGIVQPRHLYSSGTTDCVVYDPRTPSASPVAQPTCPP